MNRESRFQRAKLRAALSLSGVGLALASAVAAEAQGVAPPTRGELTGPQREIDQRRNATVTVDGQMERRPCALDNPEYAALTFTLADVTYTGIERAGDVSLLPAHQSYLGHTLPLSALCDIRDRAAAILQDAGYLAAVEIPPQSLANGRAEMRVVLGRLVAVRARGDTRGNEGLLTGYLQKLVGRETFNVDEAERYLLLANDIPGMNIRLSLRPAPGGAPGDLIGEVAVIRERFAVDVNVQNYGFDAIGPWGALARAEAYGLTGMGDRTSISYFNTLDFDEQHTLQLAHDMRLGSEGLVLGGNVTFAWTRPEALEGFDIRSETLFASLEASYPFLRTQAYSIWGAAGLDYIDQDVSVNGVDLTRDRVRTAFVRGTFERTDLASIRRELGYSPYEPQSRLTGTVELRKGLDILGGAEDCRDDFSACLTAPAVPPARIEQNPTPFFVRAELSGEYRPVPLIALAFDLEGQVSDTPLPGFEEFSAGNYSTGRGYDPGAILGDSGVGLGAELRYGSIVPKGRDKFAFQPYIFTDYAHAWNEDAGAAYSSDELWSAGGGVRFVRGVNIQGDVTLAVPLNTTHSQIERGDVRLLISITSRLFPWRS